jgi:hypothetical protein
VYSLLFDYLISIISFARELTLLAYILVIIALAFDSQFRLSDFGCLLLSRAPYTYSTWWTGGRGPHGITAAGETGDYLGSTSIK